MRMFGMGLVLCFSLIACAVVAQTQAPQEARRAPVQPEAWQLVLRANGARNEQGISPLWWDPALAEAARQHCLRMAAEGPIAHRYGGEPDLSKRAADAGAHFSLIEENVAVGASPTTIHEGWMNSPEHRENLLNPKVDRVGIAVVASRGVLYAVADYAHTVPVMTQTQVEAAIGNLVRAHGLKLLADSSDARAACGTDRGLPRSLSGPEPLFLMRWQDSDLSHLPSDLVNRLKSGNFRMASVGNCPAHDVEGSFTLYRLAVLLYDTAGTNDVRPIN